MNIKSKQTAKKATRDLTLCALFTALIAAGAFMRIPIPFVPFTLQIFFTTAAGLLLGPKGALSCLAYMLIGLAGVPIFTAGGGIGYVMQPTFGYLIGFVIGALIVGFMTERKTLTFGRIIVAEFTNIIVVYAIGYAYYYIICNFVINSPMAALPLFISGVLAVFPGNALCLVIAAFISLRMIPIVRKIPVEKLGDKRVKTLKALEKFVLAGGEISREQALELKNAPLERLCAAADKIRRKRRGNRFDLCSVINAKSGSCSEDCKFCAQSAFHACDTETYPLLDSDEIAARAASFQNSGIDGFSIVTSGGKPDREELEQICRAVAEIKASTDIRVCASLGTLDKEDCQRLKAAGINRVHNNLETSRAFFPQICTTHGYDDKLAAIDAAKSAGLDICSGGIIGLGETFEDRVDMAFELKKIGAVSIPVNILNPIAGTPLENTPPISADEVRRTAAVFRFVLPDADIRLAGGRTKLPDAGQACFRGGVNAAITSNLLTTDGISPEKDIKNIKKLGFKLRKIAKNSPETK